MSHWERQMPDPQEEIRRHIDNALTRMRQVLDATRTPTYTADVPHTYQDKYLAVERATQVCTFDIWKAKSELLRYKIVGTTKLFAHSVSYWSHLM